MNVQEKTQNLLQHYFQRQPEILVYAPGRVNIIGEHTDYNDGFVMPCAINYGTAIAGAKRDDHIFRVYAEDFQEEDQFSLLEEITPHPEAKWANYVRGMVKFIQQQCPTFTQGADLVIHGNVPLSAGLSSSAALEIAVGKFCQLLGDLPLDHTEIALLGQKTENQFVGCNCGNMDQLISALGQQDHLLMIDCRSLETRPTPVPKHMAVVIINSNVKHDLVAGEYNSRRQQCEQAAAFFGVKALRDVDIVTFKNKEAELMALDPVVAQRARHVISENTRVLQAVDALINDNIPLLGKLMQASHQSMRDDFEITIPEIDYLVELVESVIGKEGGVRMTGGGFGGCVVALVKEDKVEAIRQVVAANYQKQTGRQESFYVCEASQGVQGKKLS